jgi:thiol-disulfide isomerase/thioredoxin
MLKSKYLSTGLVAILFAATGLYFSSIYAAKPQPSDNLYIAKLPTIPAQADGSAKSLEEFRKSIVVVNFWATWCSPCVKEMPALSAMQTELAAKKIKFIGIGIDTPEAMTEFAQKYKITYPLYVAGMSGTQLSTDLGNAAGGLPFTVILNKSGAVVKTYRGKLDMDQLRKDILAVK